MIRIKPIIHYLSFQNNNIFCLRKSWFSIASNEKRSLKTGIIGCSLSGLFTGIALQSLGFDVTIFERGNNERKGGGYSVTYPLLEYLQQFNIINSSNFDHIFLKCIQTDIINADDSIEIREHADKARLSTSWDCLYWNAYKKFNEMNTNNVNNIHFNKKVIDIQYNDNYNSNTENLMEIKFDDNTLFECDLVIGCDGLGSITRSFITENNNAFMDYSGYIIWRGVVECDLINKISKLYDLRYTNGMMMYLGKDTVFLCYMIPNYYNTDNNLYNWAWFVYYNEKDLENNLLIDINNKKHQYHTCNAQRWLLLMMSKCLCINPAAIQRLV